MHCIELVITIRLLNYFHFDVFGKMTITSDHISFAFDRLSRCVDPNFDMDLDERQSMINVCKAVHQDPNLAPVVQISVSGDKITITPGVIPLDGEPFRWHAYDVAKRLMIKVKLTESETPKGLPTLESIEAIAAAHANS